MSIKRSSKDDQPGLGELVEATRYELIAETHSKHIDDLSSKLAAASRAARAAVHASNEHEQTIRDVAAGVAAPVLVGCVLWILQEARNRHLRRLRFLSRDGQVLFELAKRLGLDAEFDLEYVYSSRLTWSMAATDAHRLSQAEWLFNSFMKSNAADVCARLGISVSDHLSDLGQAGVSLDPDDRADREPQASALHRFVELPGISHAAAEKITSVRELLLEYAVQHDLADPATGLVDVGWTGRMVGSLVRICEEAGLRRPHVLFWGHEPRSTGWTDPAKVAAYMYSTATQSGMEWRVPDAPFIVETFCMGDHGIVSGYQRTGVGVEPVLSYQANSLAMEWGIALYRSVLYAFCEALKSEFDGGIRELTYELMDAFWCHPTRAEALAWGRYPYDSDPAGTAVRALASPFTESFERGDRAWVAGSLRLTPDVIRKNLTPDSSRPSWSGAPATD
jgi:hypothetical protein